MAFASLILQNGYDSPLTRIEMSHSLEMFFFSSLLFQVSTKNRLSSGHFIEQ